MVGLCVEGRGSELLLRLCGLGSLSGAVEGHWACSEREVTKEFGSVFVGNGRTVSGIYYHDTFRSTIDDCLAS